MNSGRLLPIIGLLLVGTCVRPLLAWESCSWNGEKAWRQSDGNWIAIVSTERARLVYLGPVGDFHANLLYAPTRLSSDDWGGHRFWLGPQMEWPLFWPPPPDWERKSCQAVKLEKDELALEESHADTALPVITRRYAWKERQLILSAEWTGTPKDWQGVHILQVPCNAVVQVTTVASPDLPLGYALLPLAGRRSLQTQFKEPSAVACQGNSLLIRRQGTEEKLGVPASLITVHENRYGFRFHPVLLTGEVAGKTDDARVPTQVYVGDKSNPFLEVEQLSPRLHAPASVQVVVEPFESP